MAYRPAVTNDSNRAQSADRSVVTTAGPMEAEWSTQGRKKRTRSTPLQGTPATNVGTPRSEPGPIARATNDAAGRSTDGMTRSNAGRQVSHPPTSNGSTLTPSHSSRVPIRVAPPKYHMSSSRESAAPPNLVVFDGLIKDLAHIAFGSILGRFHTICSSRMVGFPSAPVVASVHPLGGGGWTVAYADPAIAERVLSQPPFLLAEAADMDLPLADIHRPGAPTRKASETSSKVSRTVFLHLEPAVLHEISESARPQSEDSDPSGACTKCNSTDHATSACTSVNQVKSRKDRGQGGVPRQRDDKTRLESALATMFEPPAGSSILQVQVAGSTGGLLVEFDSFSAAERVIEAGLLCPALGRCITARASRHPDQRGGLPFCSRCLGVGHRPHQCGEKARCRTCGKTGHREANGVCPKNMRHPGKPRGESLFCVCCGQVGHKAGAPTCPELTRTRNTLSRGPDGSYLDSVIAMRNARTTALSESSAVQQPTATGSTPTTSRSTPNAWSKPLAGVSTNSTSQQAQIDRLERMVTGLQDQIALLLNGLGALQKSTPTSIDMSSQLHAPSDTQASSSKGHLSTPTHPQC
jgi:hypothetical protein